ncbi:Intradiol ring-cleavage dioxygenase [Xylariales sp. AK1849]|nr:Intradiol ring-cleavage dioxygenase [Xylariales sp. AK1849]
MVNFKNIAASLAVSSIIGGAVAHPGEKPSAEQVKREIEQYTNAAVKAGRLLSQAANSPEALALKKRAAARRAATVQALREKRGITHKTMFKRDQDDLEKYLAISHDVSDLGYDLDTPLEVIFDSNSTTSLVPEVTIGPYFVSGEYIRTDVTERTEGVPVHLDLQFVDINTFSPVPGFATDDDGVAEFDTVFPGHYQGRAHHIHLLSTENSTILPNQTYIAGKTDHIGQLFFNQELITEVEKLQPYATNKQQLTKTVDDGIAAGQATAEYDPFVDYILLGDDLADGLLAFITIGVDTTADYTSSYTPAAHYQEGGE